MEISNLYDDSSITDVQEKAAPVGDSLRVAVTKTSAQGKAAQSAAPNLMSFSTDENSIWFNKKNYGAVVFKDLFGLSTGSSNEEIKAALGGNTYDDISQMVDRGILFLNINNRALQHVMIRIENTSSSEGDYLHIRALSDASDTAYIKIHHYNGVFNITQNPIRSNIVFRSDVIDNLSTSLSNYPLSANMGKKLNDGKLAKTDVVNSLSDSSTNKALSAAQGHKLQTEKFAKSDVKSSYDSSTSTVYSTQYFNDREEDFEEDVRATVGPIYIPLHENGTKTIQQQSIAGDFTLVWLSDMKKIVAKSSSGSYYNNWKIENDLNPSNRDALLVVKDTTTNSPITGHSYILGDYSYRWDGSNFIQIDKTPLPTDYHCYINGLPRLANNTPTPLKEVFGSFDNFKKGIESSRTIWVDTMYSGDIMCSRRTLDNVTCAIFEGALTLRTSGTAEKDAYSGVYYIQCVVKYNNSGFLDGSTVKLYEDSIMPYYITDFPEKASNGGGRTDMDAFLGTPKDFEAAFKAGRPFRLLQSSETNTSSSNIIIVSKKSGAHSYYVQRIFATNLSDSRTCTKLHVINPTSDDGTKWKGYSVLINTELVPLSSVVNSLDSTSLYPLSANQGKQLKSLIDKIKTGIVIE